MSDADQIQDHEARCLADLISLRMLARGEAGMPPPRWVVVEIARATSAILAEAEAAGRTALAAIGAGDNRGDGTFLRVRLDRLATAANDAIAAARAGNFGELRQHLHRFDALTSAIWTVHDAVYGPRRARRPALRQVSPAP
jgi:predicted ABC-type transport system involved in lysophospholipase L1 biosynthesis ATPase subunit